MSKKIRERYVIQGAPSSKWLIILVIVLLLLLLSSWIFYFVAGIPGTRSDNRTGGVFSPLFRSSETDAGQQVTTGASGTTRTTTGTTGTNSTTTTTNTTKETIQTDPGSGTNDALIHADNNTVDSGNLIDDVNNTVSEVTENIVPTQGTGLIESITNGFGL